MTIPVNSIHGISRYDAEKYVAEKRDIVEAICQFQCIETGGTGEPYTYWEFRNPDNRNSVVKIWMGLNSAGTWSAGIEHIWEDDNE